MEVHNKTAIITGGTAGIGYGIAEVFAQKGIHLILSYAHDEARAQDVEKKLSAYGVKVLVVKADSGNEEDLKKLFTEAKDVFGKVEILVNNIGAFSDKKNPDAWEFMFRTHMMGTVHSTELFQSQLGEDQGCIINISSVSGIDPLSIHRGARLEAYCCIKSAINMYTKIASNKFAGRIRVNSIAPGNTATEGWEGSDESFKDARKKGMLIHRFVKPIEIGKTALHIVENNAIDGQIFVVDGGVVGKGYE